MTGHKVDYRRKMAITDSACSGKERFETFNAAQFGVRPHMGNRVKPYRCPVCQSWHVGESDRKRKQTNKARLR